MQTKWVVLTTDHFEQWLKQQDKETQFSVLAALKRLQFFGHNLARPYVDSVKGSRYPNMKELRIQHQGNPLRAFFAFDPLRQAIVLCAGNKRNDKQFYQKMIKQADQEFTDYLTQLGKQK